MALPALLGGFLKGAAGTGARGLVKSGITKAVKPKNKGGALVKPKQSMSIAQAAIGSIVPVKSSGGGSDGGGGALSTSIAPKSQKSTAIVKSNLSGNESAIEVLRSVKQTADQILEVEVRDLGSSEEELKQRKDQIDDERKALEASKREEEQDKQESKKKKPKRKKSNPIVNAAKKTVGGIWDFLTGILGDFIKYKILDWISKPENREKILGIVRFVQKIPEYFGIFKEKVIDPWWPVVSKIAVGGFKIFKEFLDVFLDLVTLNFLRNPDEFFENLLDIPKTIIEVIPGIIDSLLEAITGGAIKNIGELADSVFKNPLEGIDFGAALSGLGGSIGDLFKKPLEVIGGALTTAKDAVVGGAQATGQFIGDRASDTMNILGSAFNVVTGTRPAAAGTLDSAPAQPSTSASPVVSPDTVSPDTTPGEGSIEVQGTGDGGSGILSFKKGGQLVGPQYEVYSGVSSTWGSTQEERRSISGGMMPMPDGTYPLLNFDQHGAWPGLPGIGHWSSFINPGGAIGARSGIMLHSDIGSDGTAGCIGVELGGKPGTKAEKGFLSLYQKVNPKKIKVALSSSGGSKTSPAANRPTTADNATRAKLSSSAPTTAKTLTQVQRENQMLEDSGLSALQTPIVTNNSNASQSVFQETVSSSSLGATLPTSGLHATYKGV